MTATATQPTLLDLFPTSTLVMIPVGAVEWPERPETERTLDTAFAQKLAISIEYEGLHHPIQVKAIPGEPDRYEGVSGRHRHYAIGEILHRDVIEAKILSGRQVQVSEQITISENLLRSPLNKGQEALAVRKWRDHYDDEHRRYEEWEAKQKAAAVGVSVDPAPADEAQVQVGPDAEPAPSEPIEPPAKPPENFAKTIAARTGRSETAVKRSLAIGKAFTEPQLEVFATQGTSQVWMETIARLEDSDERDMAVDLISQGQEPAAAVAAATGATHVMLANGKTVDLSAVAPTDALADSELTDEQWLDVHCSAILSDITDPARFRADAIFYRRNIDFLSSCHTKIGRNSIKQTELVSLGHQSFYARTMRQFCTAHPKLWRRCDACEGTGLMKSGAVRTKTPCHACSGGGYLVTQQDQKAGRKKVTPSVN